MADRAAVIGDPVSHSLSPAIFAELSKILARPVEYSAIRVPQGMLGSELERLIRSGYAGVNVTMPHKRAAAGLVDGLDEAAEACGAVNCISFSGGGSKGHNTDADGFLDALAMLGFSPKAKDAVVFGAGGAARAAVWALVQAGAARVTVCARRPEAAKELGVEVGPPRPAALWVNATPLGWKPEDGAPFPGAFGGRFGLDMTYGRDTAFLRAAKAAGATAADGRGMLVAQAARGWELWFGPLGERKRRELVERTAGAIEWR